MFQLVCQQAEKGQHLPEGDAHCSCCSPAVRVLVLSTVRSTKEYNSFSLYMCVYVCVLSLLRVQFFFCRQL